MTDGERNNCLLYTSLSDAFFDARERDLKKRLKPKRFEHARGVSKTAASLAETYGVDVRKARLAGLLHLSLIHI